MKELVKRLMVRIPDVPRQPIDPSVPIPNINPQLGPRPLCDIAFYHDPGRYANCSAMVAQEFLDIMMAPRPRPHWALIHQAAIDDDLTAATFGAITSQVYGERWRYLEAEVRVCFHRESFLRGCVRHPTRGAIEVDAFQVMWEITKLGHRDLLARGIWRVSVIGLRDHEPIPIASLEGEYFRVRAVEHIIARG